MSHSLWSHEPGFAALHYLPEFAQTHVQWVDDAIQTILSSITPFSFCLQSLPASGSFPMSWLFASSDQSIGASASVLPMNIQGWYPLDWFDLPTVQGTLKSLTIWIFVSKMMSLLFNTLCKFVIAFLPRSKCLLISWRQSLSAVILEHKKIKSHCFHFFPIYLLWNNGTGTMFLQALEQKLFRSFGFKTWNHTEGHMISTWIYGSFNGKTVRIFTWLL